MPGTGVLHHLDMFLHSTTILYIHNKGQDRYHQHSSGEGQTGVRIRHRQHLQTTIGNDGTLRIRIDHLDHGMDETSRTTMLRHLHQLQEYHHHRLQIKEVARLHQYQLCQLSREDCPHLDPGQQLSHMPHQLHHLLDPALIRLISNYHLLDQEAIETEEISRGNQGKGKHQGPFQQAQFLLFNLQSPHLPQSPRGLRVWYILIGNGKSNGGQDMIVVWLTERKQYLVPIHQHHLHLPVVLLPTLRIGRLHPCQLGDQPRQPDLKSPRQIHLLQSSLPSNLTVDMR